MSTAEQSFVGGANPGAVRQKAKPGILGRVGNKIKGLGDIEPRKALTRGGLALAAASLGMTAYDMARHETTAADAGKKVSEQSIDTVIDTYRDNQIWVVSAAAGLAMATLAASTKDRNINKAGVQIGLSGTALRVAGSLFAIGGITTGLDMAGVIGTEDKPAIQSPTFIPSEGTSSRVAAETADDGCPIATSFSPETYDVGAEAVQTRLFENGYYGASATLDSAADGHFGEASQAALMAWQEDAGLIADGIWGNQSCAAFFGD